MTPGQITETVVFAQEVRARHHGNLGDVGGQLRRKAHLVEHIALQVHARGDFEQLDAFGRQAEARALGQVERLLAAPGPAGR